MCFIENEVFMWKMGRNVFGNDFGLGNKLKSLFWVPKLDFLTSEPGNTGTPVILIDQ